MYKIIMIADDNPRIRSIVKIYLENEGYKVIEAENGEEALQLLNEVKIDLILLDLEMPVVDGWTVCEHVSRNTTIPIILLTASLEAKDLFLGLDSGVDDYIPKPFSPRELLDRVNAVLAGRKFKTKNSRDIYLKS